MPGYKRRRSSGVSRFGKRRRMFGRTLRRKRLARSTRFKRNVAIGRGFPSKVKMVHKYVVTYPVTGSGGVMNSFNLKANGMYDPEPAVGGHQPLYFDTMTEIYNHFTVIGSRAKVKVVAAADTVAPPFKVALFLNDNTVVTPTSVDGVIEQTNSKWVQLGPDNMQATLTKSFSAKRQFGKVNTSQDGYRGNSGADPTELSYFTVALQSTDTATGAFSAYVTVEIDYIAVWTELKDIAQS